MIHNHFTYLFSTYLSLYSGRERALAVYDMQRPGRPLDEDGERNAIRRGPRHERSNVAALVTTRLATTRTSLQHVWRVQHVRSGVPLRQHRLGGRRSAVARAQPRLGMQRRDTVGTCRFGNGQGELHAG